jgi:hypothetical protein
MKFKYLNIYTFKPLENMTINIQILSRVGKLPHVPRVIVISSQPSALHFCCFHRFSQVQAKC